MAFLDFLLFASLYNNSKFRREAAESAARLSEDNYIWGADDDEFDDEFEEDNNLDEF